MESGVDFGNQLGTYSKSYVDKCNLRQCLWSLRALKLLTLFAAIIDTCISELQKIYSITEYILRCFSPLNNEQMEARSNMTYFKVVKITGFVTESSKHSLARSCNTIAGWSFLVSRLAGHTLLASFTNDFVLLIKGLRSNSATFTWKIISLKSRLYKEYD